MKNYKKYIVGLLLFAGLSFLFGFAEKRNATRKVEDVFIQFTNGEKLFITEEAVNNLLIQNELEIVNVGKDTLDLSKVETILDEHGLIEQAEVYITVDGKFGARITQKEPLARVNSRNPFYIDKNGKRMPLSTYYSARVPLLSGISEENIQEVFPVLEYINKDEFLKQHITSIFRNKDGRYTLYMRAVGFNIVFGKIEKIDFKFNNFKAFYQNALKNDRLNLYKTVDLQFGKQVIATKK